MTVPQPPRAPLSEATLRVLWRKYRGAKAAYGRTVRVQSFSRLVADPAYGPWKLFGEVCTSFGYEIEKLSMWVVRYIGGTTTWSQHAYGATGDVNYYLRGKNGYNRGWSWDKTDFTPELVDALLAIRTNNGKQVFAWGGTWRTKQDYMHWYPGCGPKDYLTGIDMSTVEFGDGTIPEPGEEEQMIQRGDKGKQVGTVQQALIDNGFPLPQWGADEDFGAETEGAVKAYQSDEELDSTGKVDGVTAAFLIPSGGVGPAGPPGPTGPRGPAGEPSDLDGMYTIKAV